MRRKICPKCKSPRLARSRMRSFRERLTTIAGSRPYRCTNCGWRGYLKSRQSAFKSVLGFFLVVFALIWIAIATYYIFQDSVEDYKMRIEKKVLTKPKPAPKPPAP